MLQPGVRRYSQVFKSTSQLPSSSPNPPTTNHSRARKKSPERKQDATEEQGTEGGGSGDTTITTSSGAGDVGSSSTTHSLFIISSSSSSSTFLNSTTTHKTISNKPIVLSAELGRCPLHTRVILPRLDPCAPQAHRWLHGIPRPHRRHSVRVLCRSDQLPLQLLHRRIRIDSGPIRARGFVADPSKHRQLLRLPQGVARASVRGLPLRLCHPTLLRHQLPRLRNAPVQSLITTSLASVLKQSPRSRTLRHRRYSA